MELSKILQFIIYDPFRKIIAIIFAFGLWFFVSLDGIYQQTKKVGIVYTNVAESLVITDSISHLEATLRGRGSALFSTWAAPPKVRCDCTGKRPGTYEIPVGSLSISMPFNNITVNHSSPLITITIDTIVEQEIAVSVPLRGTLKQGYSVNDIIIKDTIMVTGPRDLLQTMEAVLTETLDVKNRSMSFSKIIRLAPVSPLIHVSQPAVEAEILVDTTIERRFTNIPLKLIFTPYQRVTSEKISLDTLLIKGPRSRMNLLNKGDITVRITLTQLSTGEYELPATIILPDYITPVYSSPKRFSIKIF
ncbi:YbbR-like domain-containing protein [candidate division WOR-3 bacterium]|nr:YbbR-like domain-containing protein [candidate division WOR-3 bacterium]